jgi:nuclear GTP-binding protein
LLLRDWATGKLPRYSVPSKGPEVIDFAAAPANANEVHLEDVKTLENVQTRVEKRKVSGLLRISAGVKDSREPEWERRWDSVGGRGAESDGDDDGDVEGDAMDDLDEEDEVGEDDDEDEDEEDEVASIITADNSEEEDEEEVPPPPPAKRKRVPLEVAASAPASKRVAFGKAAPSAKSNPAVSLVTPAPKSVLKPAKSSRSSLRALKADKPKPKPTAPSAVDGKKPKVSVAEARKTQKKADLGVIASLSKTRSGKIASRSAAGKNDDGAYKFGEFF